MIQNAKSREKIDEPCPSCGAAELKTFYDVTNVPAHSVLLLSTQEEAVNYPTGDITLAHCQVCGFISNTKFDPGLHEYSSRYEETQGFSPTFNIFHKQLAEHLVKKYGLRHKDILEIGCGKGEFLTMICDLGQNRGIGFDPAYIPGRINSERVTFIKDFYSEKYAEHTADFICCKMTLEHIPDVEHFVSVIRRAIADKEDTIVFFQVPDIRRILKDVAFWDVYYEHCSYFSLGSLARLFRRSGFDIIDLWQDYGDQYLMIGARPAEADSDGALKSESDLNELSYDVEEFVTALPQRIDVWADRLQQYKEQAKKVVLWGGGSKGVAFLTTLKVGLDSVQYVVDINPYKSGTFMAGTGQEIVAPELLNEYKPDVVIVMNPVYRDEIGRDLRKMGLSPTLLTV